MKIRTDFVTNSSSSSFVLAFDNKKDLVDFKEDNDFCDYREFYNLVENLNSVEMVFSNESEEPIPFSVFNDTVENLNLSQYAMEQFNSHKDDIIEKWGSVSIYLSNPLIGEFFDISSIGWDDMDGDGWNIHIYDKSDNFDKEKIIDFLKRAMSFDFLHKLTEENVPTIEGEEFLDRNKREKEYQSSPECQELLEKYLQENGFYEKKKRIEESVLTVSGMIWDTSGGVLEWAIRNGFIEDNYRKNCIIVYNVG